MVENLYNFEKILKHISVNEDIFKPNLTTKLSIEEIDKAVHQAIALHKKYVFNGYALESLVGLSRSALQYRMGKGGIIQ